MIHYARISDSLSATVCGSSSCDARSLAVVRGTQTGWYDGQVWVKTPQMLMRDRLMGTYQVKQQQSSMYC
jgi:hypothetical protein